MEYEYANMTNRELLDILHDKRQYSPVIDELCYRLERYMPENQKGTVIKTSCHICEAPLKLEVDINQLGDYKMNVRPDIVRPKKASE